MTESLALAVANKLPHPDYRCGTVVLAGRPNVGKSTLLNVLVGMPLSIVSHRPQTTRHRMLGIATDTGGQILYIDTPGLHKGGKRAMNRGLNRTARSALAGVDVLVQVIEAGRWTEEDQGLYQALEAQPAPRLLAVNKVDLLRDKAALLPFVENLLQTHQFEAVYYLSALKSKGLRELEAGIRRRLPIGPPVFGEDEITDRSERFLSAEIIREQLMLRLDQELPYASTVEIEHFHERGDGMTEIHAIIWVERDGQKAIVIGQGGERLKAIGTSARRRLEQLFARKVFLKLWVKVREGWTDDANALKRFGLGD